MIGNSPDTNRIDEARAYLLHAKNSLRTLEDALNTAEAQIGQPPSSRIPALDAAARAALNVDFAVDELAVSTCWLTLAYRKRLEQRESMSRDNPGKPAGRTAAAPDPAGAGPVTERVNARRPA